MGLRAKFNLVILAAFGVGFLIATLVLDRIYLAHARDQVVQNARFMMSSANAIRTYTAKDIAPMLPLELNGQYVRETVPAYAAQKHFRELQATFPDYSYREAALNPTNLANRAQDWEADMINLLRSEPTREEVIGERTTPRGPTLNLARPISVRDEGCLLCHGSPASAPPAVVRTYGSTNGFGWKLNETIGAQIVTVPMAVAVAEARASLVTFLMVLTGSFVVILVILNGLLHVLVIQPVKKVSAMADAASLGEEVETYVKPGKDEISSLSVSFDRMRQSLDRAMQMLRG